MDKFITNLILTFIISSVFFLRFPVVTGVSVVILVVAIYLLFSYRFNIKFAGVLVLVNYIYWLFSGFISGGISIGDFLNIEFIKGEGRIFLYYLPILYFSLVNTSWSNIKFLTNLLYVLAITSFLLSVLWIFNTDYSLLKSGVDFSGFITSHTGAGTFFATMLVFFLVKAFMVGSRIDYYMAIIVSLPLFLTSSRQALLSVLITLLWFFFRKKKYKYILYFLCVLSIIIIFSVNFNFRAIERFKTIFTYEFVSLAQDMINDAEGWQPGDDLLFGLSYDESQVNILNRFLFWVKAISDFEKSPFVGIGFGRYNDIDVSFSGYPNLLLNIGLGAKEKIVTVASAHNSYLHFLSEIGVFGLFLNLFFWYYLYVRLDKLEKINNTSSCYYVISKSLIFFIFFNALFGHALAAPAIGFLTLSIIGSAYSLSSVGSTKTCFSGR